MDEPSNPSQVPTSTPAPRPALTRVDPNKKVSDEEWEVIKALYCAGEKARVIAENYPIKPQTITKKAASEQWPTPGRIKRALKKQVVNEDDPAAAVAKLWKRRGEESRESTYNGASKALERFFASAPVPQSFAEAATANRMLNEAINPPSDEGAAANVNIAVLTTQGFKPKPVIEADVVDPS